MLNYTFEGEGTVFLFLHGFLESSTMWNFLDLEKLPIRKLMIDLPGHGKSSLSSDAVPSIMWMANEVNKVLVHEHINELVVIGHSMGGYVGIELAKLNPLVTNVVLLNSNFWADSFEKKLVRDRVVDIVTTAKNKFIQEAIPGLFFEPDKYIKQIDSIIEEAKSFDTEGIVFSTIAMRDRLDNTDWIKDNYFKVKIIQGELDTSTPFDLMKEKLPDSVWLYLIRNAGHMTHIEASNEIEDLLVNFS
jgi:2-succinyl-6-hydroxy-2,4-cyclohexadiene-1-carboxylate synthase